MVIWLNTPSPLNCPRSLWMTPKYEQLPFRLIRQTESIESSLLSERLLNWFATWFWFQVALPLPSGLSKRKKEKIFTQRRPLYMYVCFRKSERVFFWIFNFDTQRLCMDLLMKNKAWYLGIWAVSDFRSQYSIGTAIKKI